jgi:putative oxidoreductase
VRHLFSNFASGWPAFGLLIIRIVAGIVLIADGIMRFRVGQPVLPLSLDALTVVDGAMLVAGLWTPLAGALAVAASAGGILIFHENAGAGALLAAMGAGLALVGPGAISIDAWIYGLKRIDIEKLNGPPRQ